MTMQRRMVPATLSVMPDDQVLIRMSTGALARDGSILVPAGCVLDNYRENPIQLWQHNPDMPVGTNSEVSIGPDGIEARTTFAPIGVSPTADMVRGLVKAGVVRGVSIGFEIIEAEPLDPKKPRGGVRAVKWELLESSFVSIPADTGAMVVARAIDETPDQSQENPGMAAADEAFAAKRLRMLAVTPHKARGLYDVACLAHMLEHLGYIHGSAVWESEIEADDSKVPAMLGEALKGLGETLIAMTTEEVNELLTGKGIEEIPPVDETVVIEERAFVTGGKTPAIRAWRQGRATMALRTGKAISQANAAKIDQAAGHLDNAANRGTEAAGHIGKAIEHSDNLADLHGKASAAHEKMGAAIEDANGSAPEDVAKKIAKVQQAHKQIGKHLDAMGDRCAAIGDVQADAQGAIAGAQRCVRSAMRCVRGVQDANGDTDVKDIQTSDGDADSEGSGNDRAFTPEARRRRLAALELAAA